MQANGAQVTRKTPSPPWPPPYTSHNGNPVVNRNHASPQVSLSSATVRGPPWPEGCMPCPHAPSLSRNSFSITLFCLLAFPLPPCQRQQVISQSHTHTHTRPHPQHCSAPHPHIISLLATADPTQLRNTNSTEHFN